MRWAWLLLILFITLLPGGGRPSHGRTPSRVRLVSWTLGEGLAAECEEQLERARRVLAPQRAEIAGLLWRGPGRERLAERTGFPTLLASSEGLLLTRLPVRGYRTFAAGPGRALEVHFDHPWPLAVVLARAPEPRASWRVAHRIWELQVQCPGRALVVLGDLGPPEEPWLTQVGLRAPLPGLFLDPLASPRLRPTSLKVDQRRLVRACRGDSLRRLDLR